MAEFTEEENYEDALRLAELMATLNTLGKPTIARVNGHAFGGAVGLVACCDIVIAAPRARFCLSEVRLGLVPAVISPFVMQKIGVGRARTLFLTGERFDGKEAERIGLVSSVVPHETLLSTAAEMAAKIAANPPLAVRNLKEGLRLASHGNVDDLGAWVGETLARLFQTEDHREAVRAFVEKRKPTFRGR